MRMRVVSIRNLTEGENRLAMRRVKSWSRCRRNEEDSGSDGGGGVERRECWSECGRNLDQFTTEGKLWECERERWRSRRRRLREGWE